MKLEFEGLKKMQETSASMDEAEYIFNTVHEKLVILMHNLK